MGDLLNLHDEHEQVQMLLPWHTNGTLEPEEAAWLESHLGRCAQCRVDLEIERALRREIAGLPLEIEPTRPPMFEPAAARPSVRAAGLLGWLRRRITLGWALAGQAAVAATVAAVFLIVTSSQPEGEYRLLGSERNGAEGNAIVLFAPETTERELRGALVENGARLVEGPTASGAYVVWIDEARRSEGLERLRQRPQVMLAEPIDAGRDR